MPPVARKVMTPGSRFIQEDREKEKKKSKKDKVKKKKDIKKKRKKKDKEKQKKEDRQKQHDNKNKDKENREKDSAGRKQKKKGRPKKLKRLSRSGLKLRATYSEEDMLEAIRLVREEGMSIKAASRMTNQVKKQAVPRSTIQDRLLTKNPLGQPSLGRPVELPEEVEKALVKCLKMCGEFQYPMRPTDLQDLVQSYCISNDVMTRWEQARPGREWCKLFRKRWRAEIKLKRPQNIKRSRAAVSPDIVEAFFVHARQNLMGVPATHIVNYDESPLQAILRSIPT